MKRLPTKFRQIQRDQIEQLIDTWAIKSIRLMSSETKASNLHKLAKKLLQTASITLQLHSHNSTDVDHVISALTCQNDARQGWKFVNHANGGSHLSQRPRHELYPMDTAVYQGLQVLSKARTPHLDNPVPQNDPVVKCQR